MIRIFGSPPRYVQGPGALDRLREIAAGYGPRPVVVSDQGVLDLLGARLGALFEGFDPPVPMLGFAGEITYPAIDALAARAADHRPDVLIAIGGGKALDAGKGVAVRLGVPVVTAPTIASNDSPTSASIAVYDDRHAMIAVDRMLRSPDAVVVDTAVIASAPARFLRWGIGDALAKKFEAEGCWAGTGNTPFGTRPLRTAIAVADACYRTLRAHAAAALDAVERRTVTDDLEAVVEATVLMSGLGFENGGLSIAHSLTRGLVLARGAAAAPHGEHVAYGLLVQLALEGRDDGFILDLMRFHREIGLPCRLSDVGMPEPAEGEVSEIAARTMTAPHIPNLGVPVSAPAIVDAMWRVERLAAAGAAAAVP